MTDEEGRPLEEEAHGDVVWVKARDTLLGAAPKGREMDDGCEVEAEAALVLTAPFGDTDGDALVIIEGSYRRLLKTLDYARSALIGSAPALELVGDPNDTMDDSAGETAGLRCPHCGKVTWENEGAGVTMVQAGDRYVDLALRRRGQELEVFGTADEQVPMQLDHFECANCERPVALPAEVGITF